MRLPLALLCLAATGLAWGDLPKDVRCENKSGPRCGDRRVPNYVLPGQFEGALAHAKKTNRPLLIKGVAFGMDRVGATEPTKGHW